jgi:hypothetical protein
MHDCLVRIRLERVTAKGRPLLWRGNHSTVAGVRLSIHICRHRLIHTSIVCSFPETSQLVPSKNPLAFFESSSAALPNLPEAMKAELLKLNQDAVREAVRKAANMIVLLPAAAEPARKKRANLDGDGSDPTTKAKYNKADKDKVKAANSLLEVAADVEVARAADVMTTRPGYCHLRPQVLRRRSTRFRHWQQKQKERKNAKETA